LEVVEESELLLGEEVEELERKDKMKKEDEEVPRKRKKKRKRADDDYASYCLSESSPIEGNARLSPSYGFWFRQ
jgi:hypothetical protein